MTNHQPSPHGQALADIEAGRASITALRDEAREYGRMPFKVRDMHVMLLHRLLDELSQQAAQLRAAVEQLPRFAQDRDGYMYDADEGDFMHAADVLALLESRVKP